MHHTGDGHQGKPESKKKVHFLKDFSSLVEKLSFKGKIIVD